MEADRAKVFAVNVTAGAYLDVALTDSTSTDSNEVYLRYGLPPTRADFDFGYTAVGAANQNVWSLRDGRNVVHPGVRGCRAGVVQLHAAGDGRAGGRRFLHSQSAGQQRRRHTLRQRRRLHGEHHGRACRLRQHDLQGQVQVEAATNSRRRFPRGRCRPVCMLSPSARRADRRPLFLPRSPSRKASPNLVTSLIVPGAIGNHIPATLYVQYANTGNAPMPAPMLMLTATRDGVSGAR